MTMGPDEFLRTWHRVVAELLVGQRHQARSAAVERLLEHGLTAVAGELPAPQLRPAPTPDDILRAEQALVKASGMLDEDRYTAINSRVRGGWIGALEHFTEAGWRELINPGLGFDVWWYWSEYLDPARETANPLVHYLLDGRFTGCSPVPEIRVPQSVPHGFPNTRRVCLFAGYDPHGLVDDYVIAYLRELGRHADVFYLFDGYLHPEELDKLAPVTKGAWAVPHGRYDFGSYSMLARELVGWSVIEQYDELLLVNDSAYLVRSLDDVFAEMDGRTCDWWGMQASKHDYHTYDDRAPRMPLSEAKRRMIGEHHMDDIEHLHVSSYFLAFRQRVLGDAGFRRRLDAVVAQADKALVIRKYEIGLSRYLMCSGFDVDTFIPDLYPFHPLYTRLYFELLERGFPLLKRNLLTENSRFVPDLRHWKERVRAIVPGADTDLIEANLLRVAPHDKLHRSFALDSREHRTVRVHRPLNQWQVAREDAESPKFDHWWAFVVDASDHTLTGSLRAVFEAVRLDPTLKKVVLTRTRGVSVDGENVVCLPLESRQGQFHLARARFVFVRERPGDRAYGHHSPRNHHIIQLGGVPLRPFPATATTATAGSAENGDAPLPSPYRAVVTGSQMQALAAAQAYAPLGLDDVWTTGMPRNDLLLRSSADLPADLRRQEEALAGRLQGRPLLLFAPAFDIADPGRGYPLVDRDVLDGLTTWCERTGGVVGFYDDVRDRARQLARVLDPLEGWNLRKLGIDEHVVVDRVATGLVTDLSPRAVDFAASGKEIVLWADDRVRSRLYFDPESLPVRVVADADTLGNALDDICTPLPSDLAAARATQRRMLVGVLDDRNSERLVRRIRTGYIRAAL